jgi:hypothetical protein
VLSEVAANVPLARLNGPRAVAVSVSVAYVTLEIDDTCEVEAPRYPPPNHPAVGPAGGAATRVKPPPVIVNPPDIVILILFKPLSYDRPAQEPFVPPLYVLYAIGPRKLAVLVSVAYVIRCTVDIIGLWPPANHPYVVSPVAVSTVRLNVNGPRILAPAVSVAYVIRCTVLNVAGAGEFEYPPPNHPSVVVPVAAKRPIFLDKKPRTLAVAVSVAYVMRSMVE